MKSSTHAPALIALAVAAALAAGAVPQAVAATSASAKAAQADECQRSSRGADRRDRDSSSRQAPVEERYPDATRESPSEGASARMGQRLNRLNNAMNDEDYAEALEHAQDIL